LAVGMVGLGTCWPALVQQQLGCALHFARGTWCVVKDGGRCVYAWCQALGFGMAPT
jgi:hypothetical protein